MKKYETTKYSGINFLGEIPENWQLWKFKTITSILTCGYASTPEYVSEENGVPFLSAQNVKPGRIVLDKYNFISKKLHSDLTRNKKPIKGDVLVARVGGEGNIGDAALVDLDFEFSVYVSLTHIRPRKNLYNKFLIYFFQSGYSRLLAKIETQVGGGVGNLNVKDMERYKLPIPPLTEQRQIATYLDYKTKQIDRFITNRKKQIELLEEQKEAIINKAITVGVNNDDIEDIDTHWYSQNPKNWELLKFNAAINLIHGFQFRDNDFTAEGIKIVKITQLNANGTLDLTNADTIDEKRLSSFKSRIIKNGDILMALTGGTIGKIIRVEDLDEIVLQNYRVGKFEPRYKNQLSKRYLFWVLRSEKTFAQINFLLRETGQPNIGKGDFSKMFFALPPTIEEQDLIADFIEKELAERNELISKYQKQIDLMQEYKTSLISKAVTGKIDVREWQPKQTIKETV